MSDYDAELTNLLDEDYRRRHPHGEQGWTPYAEVRRWRRRFYWLLALGSLLVAFLLMELAKR